MRRSRSASPRLKRHESTTMKKQINPSIKAHLLRSALILLSLLAICAIPFALAQSRSRGTNDRSVANSQSKMPAESSVPLQTPTPTGTPSPSATAACFRPPPGQCVSYEAEADNNTLTGSAFVLSCPTCSGGQKVGYVGSNSGTKALPVSVLLSASASYDTHCPG